MEGRKLLGEHALVLAGSPGLTATGLKKQPWLLLAFIRLQISQHQSDISWCNAADARGLIQLAGRILLNFCLVRCAAQ